MSLTARESCLIGLFTPVAQAGLPVVVFTGDGLGSGVTDRRLAWAAYATGAHCESYLLNGANTREEAEDAVTRFGSALILVTSRSHLLRAFLTTLRVCQKRQLLPTIWGSAPQDGPEDDWERELSRIESYQRVGDVATYESGRDYFQERKASCLA